MATEDPTVAIQPVPEQPAGEKQTVKTGKSKKTKEPKVQRPGAPRKPRTTSSHPPYEEMIKDAIVSLKERNGSSQYAITKFIEEKQKELPSNFKKLLLVHLKKLVGSGKIVKVKASFKLPSGNGLAPKPAIPVKKKLVSATKPKPKGAAKTKEVKTKPAAAKSPVKAKVAAKPKAKAVAKPKAAAKPKAVATKSKTSGAPEPKAAGKRKTAAKPKIVEKPAKAARTSTRISPGKKSPAPKPVKKVAPAVRKPTARSVKSPAKKAAAKRGRK